MTKLKVKRLGTKDLYCFNCEANRSCIQFEMPKGEIIYKCKICWEDVQIPKVTLKGE